MALLAREDMVDAEALGPLLAQSARSDQDGHAPEDLDGAVVGWLRHNRPEEGAIYNAALAALERPLFAEVLAMTGGNQLRAAKLLGINRNTLRKRLGDLALDPERFAHRT
jgi:two-component system, NtrC family, nitrogen regulation response regulator GlnG